MFTDVQCCETQQALLEATVFINDGHVLNTKFALSPVSSTSSVKASFSCRATVVKGATLPRIPLCYHMLNPFCQRLTSRRNLLLTV